MDFDFDRVYDRMGTENSKWHTYPPDVLPMYVADMDFRSPEVVIRALRERVEHGFFGYGKEQPEFFETVAERMRRRYGWEVEPESVVVVPGVITAFNLAAKKFLAPGQGILMHAPTYPPILHCNEKWGLERHETPLVEGDGRYEVDWDAFDAAIRPSTGMFLLCNPHNPTGRVFERRELERMAQTCLDRGILICSDEIHCDLVYETHRHTPIASISPEIAARTITLMAPSKTFNLPGLKFSIAVITDQELREQFVAARDELVRASNILGYTAAFAAYRDGDEWLAALLKYLDGNRQFLAGYLREHLPAIRFTPPEGTYLAWLDCRALPIENPSAFFLEEAKVALNDGATFGPTGQGFVRLNFACPRTLLVEGLDRMRQAVERLGG